MEREQLTGSNVFYNNIPFYTSIDSSFSNSSSCMGIIVLQEWWGVTDHIKRMTQRFSMQLNAVATTPDLYRGKVAANADEASHLMHSLDWDQAIKDIKTGYDYLLSLGAKKVGIVGFCMGGALTLASAQSINELSAASCFYGIPPPKYDPSKIMCPLQCHFGEKDHAKGFSDLEAASKLKKSLIDAGKDVSEFYIHPNADHAFMNEDSPAFPFNEIIAKDAMAKTIAFFKKNLV